MTRTIYSIIAICFMLFFFTITVTRAQTPLENVTINYLEATPDDNGQVIMSVYVAVSAADGQPLTNLSKDNFTILEDGKPIDRDSMAVAVAADPITIILAMDISGSMAKAGKDGVLAIDSAKQAATTFTEKLSDGDQIAIYSFSNQVKLQQDFTLDHNLAINQGINPLIYTDFGQTCLYEALLKAVKKSAEIQRGRRAVIVLTDGDDTTSKDFCNGSTLQDVLDEATVSTLKVPIFTVGFGEINEQELSRLAQQTRGRSLIAADSSALEGLFTSISNQLRNQYRVSYPTQTASGEHMIVVKVEAGGSQNQDNRQVFVPVSSPTAPSATKSFTISLTAGEPMEGKLEIKVNLPPSKIFKTELFVDNSMEKRILVAPFDKFILETTKLSSGTHTIRVEATLENGSMAFDQRELTVIGSTPTSSATPTLVNNKDGKELPTSTPLPSGKPGLSPYLLFALMGLLLLFILMAGVVFYFIVRRKATPTPSATMSISAVPPMITTDLAEPFDPDSTLDGEVSNDKTIFVAPPPPEAKLIVLKGRNTLEQDVFLIKTAKITLGRNAEGARNDVNIQDKSVSRHHAEISFNNFEFVIRDVGSTFGTRVSGMKITPHQDVPLQDATEIDLGPNVKFKFEMPEISKTIDLSSSVDRTEDNDDEEDDETFYNKKK